jgi:hypothetical protein
MEPHVDEDIFGMCKHWQNALQAEDCTHITQIHQIGLVASIDPLSATILTIKILY